MEVLEKNMLFRPVAELAHITGINKIALQIRYKEVGYNYTFFQRTVAGIVCQCNLGY